MEPELSAILVAGELRERAARSLRHLLDQTILSRMEIVVADLNPELGLAGVAGHPAVRHLRLPHLAYYCEALAAGVREARAPLVAFIEDHGYASPGWAEAVREAFADPRVGAVNYAFTPAGHGYLSRSILLAEYGYWMAPHPGGPVDIAASANIAYRRDLLLRHLEAAGDSSLEADFLIHRALQAEGWRIVVAPRATVAHESWGRLSDACRANGAGRRLLAVRRAALGRWGAGRRILMVSAMAAMPAFSLLRLARSLRGRRLWGTFVRGLPVVASIYTFSAGCEALGYLLGPGQSREQFRARALAIERDG